MNEAHVSIGYVLSLDSAKHCQKFSVVEQHSREPMSFANPKVEFSSVIEPHCQMTAENVAEHKVVLCVGTTFLDYGSIEAKKRLQPNW